MNCKHISFIVKGASKRMRAKVEDWQSRRRDSTMTQATENGAVPTDEALALRRTFSFSNHETYGTAFKAYFVFVNKCKFWIVVVWIALMAWGGATGFRYIREARDQMTAPTGSRADLDGKIFGERFKELSTSTQMILLVSCKDPNSDCMVSCKKSAFKRKCQGFNEELKDFSFRVQKEIFSKSQEYNAGYSNETMGYYIFAGTSEDVLKSQFTSSDGKATFLVFTGSGEVKSENRYKLVEEISREGGILERLNPNRTKYSMGITGVDPMTREGSTAAIEQSERIDMITMPIAFALLAYMVRSWRLLLISLFNMGITILTSFGFLTVLTDATGKPPMTTTASFVEVLGLAMCVDASLFFLRRFRDEIKNGREPELAIKIMMSQAGHVVMMSSLTIIFVFAGFLFMKSTDLMVQGLACVVTVSCSLSVNMTNTPALLLIFPHFFGVFSHSNTQSGQSCMDQLKEAIVSAISCCKQTATCCRQRSDSLSDEYARLDDDALSMQYLTSPTAEVLRQRGGPYKGFYFRVLKVITRWPWNIVSLVSLYIMVIPLALQALDLERNQNLMLAIPRNSDSSRIFKALKDDFSDTAGMLSPLYVMVDGPQTVNSLHDPATYKQMRKSLQTLSKKIAKDTNIPESSLTSIASIPRILCLRQSSLCDFLWKRSVNALNTSSIITIIVPFDPFSKRMETFIGDVFNSIDGYKAEKPSEVVKGVYFAGLQVGMVEDMRISFDQFPLLVAVTCVVVFTLIAVMLQSAFVLIRLSLTVVLPLAAMFGLSVMVYQKGLFDWTGIQQLSSSDEGFFWYVPVLCFTLTVGLALDYDVLVISRIREHRFGGLSIRAAIVRSMWEVNSTLIAAGLIMTLAFGSLLISDTAAVNQMSFILSSSVLFDTFVIQTLVVPCIMSFADHSAWWPVHPPMDNLISLEEEIETRNKAFEEFAPVAVADEMNSF